jgi:hypothetical protein
VTEPTSARVCAICGVVVANLVTLPGGALCELRRTQAWGATPIPEYRCIDHREQVR